MIDITAMNYLDLAITFVIGLLMGLSIKKGLVAFILLFVAFILSGFVGLTFLPTIPPSKFINLASKYFYEIVNNLHLGLLVVSLSIILFLAGLIVGILKG
ncbi:MAG: hypothetical protein ACP5MU_04670 [Thermoplasmata archaeon]